MLIVSKSEQASLNFEQKYNSDSSFSKFLKNGFEHQGVDVSGEPDQVRVYEGPEGEPVGYIVIYDQKGCFVVQKEHADDFQHAMAWYMRNPKKLCYRYTDEAGFQSQGVMNQIFGNQVFNALKAH